MVLRVVDNNRMESVCIVTILKVYFLLEHILFLFLLGRSVKSGK